MRTNHKIEHLIQAAHEPSECICDCTSWGNHRDDYSNDDLDYYEEMDYLDNTETWRTND